MTLNSNTFGRKTDNVEPVLYYLIMFMTKIENRGLVSMGSWVSRNPLILRSGSGNPSILKTGLGNSSILCNKTRKSATCTGNPSIQIAEEDPGKNSSGFLKRDRIQSPNPKGPR